MEGVVQDFDVIRAERRAQRDGDRKFKIGGKTFEFAAYSSPDLYASVQLAMTDPEWLEAADAFMESVLETPAAKKDWKAVRNGGAKQPLSFTDIRQVMDHVVEVTSGRPIAASNGSSPGSSDSGTSSTAPAPETA